MSISVRFSLVAGILFLILWSASGVASEKIFPVIDGRETIALVNGEPVSLKEFNEMLSKMHETMDETKKPDKIDYSEPLKRLINGKLIIYEAINIGIDELPEITKQMDNFSKDTLKKLLLKQKMKDIQPDKGKVDKIYKEKTREYKIKSAYFSREKYALEMEKEVKRGGNFENVVKKLTEEGKVDAWEEGEYIKDEKLLPHVSKVVSEMKNGSISPIIKVEKGFVIVKLEDTRFPENSEAREHARKEALRPKIKEALDAYAVELKNKYVKVNEDLLDAVDFEANEPGFESFLNDDRIIAEIKGDNPVSIADLTDAIRKKYFHGVKTAISEKKMNKQKTLILEKLLQEKVFLIEAKSLHIDKSEEYLEEIKKYQNNIIFSAFIRKVIDPEITIDEEELRSYYKEHSGEYATPEMMRINNLIFDKREAAEDAIDKLRAGADFKWVEENADHLIDKKNGEKLLVFSGGLITTRGMPEDVRKSVEGARSGDYRFLENADGQFHVLYIQEVVPPKPEKFENVRKSLIEKIVQEKRTRSLEKWSERLRAASDIKIFATDAELGHIKKK